MQTLGAAGLPTARDLSGAEPATAPTRVPKPSHERSSGIHQPPRLCAGDQQPLSEHFDDIYFSADGAQEVQRIFLQPSRVVERASQSARSWFTVGELGFGSALNFTVTADTFLQQGCGNLHFISVEAHPLRDSDWQIVARLRPDSATAEPSPSFPALLSGWHRRSLHGGQVQLSVFHGDVNAALTELEQYQRQPVTRGFWTASPRAKIRTCGDRPCWPNSRPSVMPAPRWPPLPQRVRYAGISQLWVSPWKKWISVPSSARVSSAGLAPKTSKPSHLPPNLVNVLGGGIAGASVARQLADMGIAVRVFDPAGIATGGSKMNVSALHARLLGDQSPAAEFRARAFHHARASSGFFSRAAVHGRIAAGSNGPGTGQNSAHP